MGPGSDPKVAQAASQDATGVSAGQRATSGTISGALATAAGLAVQTYAASHGVPPELSLPAGAAGGAIVGATAAAIGPWSRGVLEHGDQATGVPGFVWSIARLPFLVLAQILG